MHEDTISNLPIVWFQSLFLGEKVYISTCDVDKNIWEMIDFVKDLTKLRPGKRFTKNDKIKVLKD